MGNKMSLLADLRKSMMSWLICAKVAPFSRRFWRMAMLM